MAIIHYPPQDHGKCGGKKTLLSHYDTYSECTYYVCTNCGDEWSDCPDENGGDSWEDGYAGTPSVQGVLCLLSVYGLAVRSVLCVTVQVWLMVSFVRTHQIVKVDMSL